MKATIVGNSSDGIPCDTAKLCATSKGSSLQFHSIVSWRPSSTTTGNAKRLCCLRCASVSTWLSKVAVGTSPSGIGVRSHLFPWWPFPRCLQAAQHTVACQVAWKVQPGVAQALGGGGGGTSSLDSNLSAVLVGTTASSLGAWIAGWSA